MKRNQIREEDNEDELKRSDYQGVGFIPNCKLENIHLSCFDNSLFIHEPTYM